LFIGACLNVHARQLVIKDFGDAFTRRALTSQMESTFLVVKPSGFKKLGAILDALVGNKYTVCQLRLVQLNAQLAQQLLPGVSPAAFTNGPSVVLEIVREQAFGFLKAFLGLESDVKVPRTLGSILQLDDVSSLVYALEDQKAAAHVHAITRQPNWHSAGPLHLAQRHSQIAQ
jgi:hypothetical protein